MASITSPLTIAQKDTAPVRPSLCMKPSPGPTSPSSTTVTTPSSLLSKEWVVPPRPKPGRKPAIDTPPTKRKAQNRAAQRAFRERRAARVGELEEQMKIVEEEHEREQESLRETVERLEKEVGHYQSELNRWVERYRILEKDLAHHHSATNTTDAVSLLRRATARSNEASQDSTDVPMGCGNCTLDSRCQCLDDAFNAMGGTTNQIESNIQEKRPHSPVMTAVEKRVKLEPQESLEIDFTAIYATRVPAQSSRPAVISSTSATADRCGFCQDGTSCICAEMAAEADQQQAASELRNGPDVNLMPRMHELSQYTPPPSEGDVPIANPCASGPGTCAQCRADPKSTLFCKSLAASRSLSSDAVVGCCGGKSSSGSCCQTIVQPSTTRSTRSKAATESTRLPQLPTTQLPSITLTCADAYTTLSRHPGYDRASGEIATWMPKLQANELHSTINKASTAGQMIMEGRPAMEIDAANVMAVLKDFDRRFGPT